MALAWQRLLISSHVVVMTLLLARLPRLGHPEELDCAWQGLLQRDWNEGARSGVDSVFTYGATGYLLAQSTFAPEGLWTRTLLGIGLALSMALGLASLVRHLPNGAWRAAYLLGLIAMAPFLEGSIVFQTMVTLGVVSLLALTESSMVGGDASVDRARRRRTTAGVALLLGTMVLFCAMGMAKFTYFALAVGEVAIVVLVALASRRVRLAVAAAALFPAVFLSLWLAVGQATSDLAAWWRGAIEIATGYNDVMGTAGAESELQLAMALLAGNVLLAAVLMVAAHREAGSVRALSPAALRRGGAMVIVLLGLFASWKAGFVRHDDSHAVMFFGYAAAMPLLLVAASGVRSVSALARVMIAGTVLAAAWQQIAVSLRLDGGRPIAQAAHRAIDILAPVAFVDELERSLAGQRHRPPLPRLRDLVGDEPVDLIGYRQGLLLASGMHVRHRPVFQSYSAYTPYLQQLNGDFFRGLAAPRLVLAEVRALGGRLPMAEDSQAWRALLDDYHPIAVEHDVLLLARDPEPLAGAAPRRRVVDRHVDLGEWVLVPLSDDWHELGLTIDYSTWGRAMAFLHRPARLSLEVRLRTGEQRAFSISPKLVQASFVLDPLIRSNRDFVEAGAGRPSARIGAFRVVAERGGERCYRAHDIAVRLDARPRAEHVGSVGDRHNLDAVLSALTYPAFDWFPFRIEPEQSVRSLGPLEQGVLAAAPCTMQFRWPGGRHRLVVHFEILRGGWSGLVRTDGAVFRVEVDQAEGRRVVAERLLQPADRVLDRGEQRFDLELDLPRDGVVSLVTDVGPAGKNQYDLTVWRRVALDPR